MPEAWVVSLHADNPLSKAFRKLPSGRLLQAVSWSGYKPQGTTHEAPATATIVRPPGGRSLHELRPSGKLSKAPSTTAKWNENEGRVGRKRERSEEEEEKGLDLSKSDQLAKKKKTNYLTVTGFLPASKADFIFPPDG